MSVEREFSPEIPEVIVVVTGLGLGEETKGATVEWLTKILKAHTVIRSGGCNAGHHIITSDGKEQMFNHYGCGTFEGANTYLLHMTLFPVYVFDEAKELEEKGVKEPLKKIAIGKDCVAITPYHGAVDRIKEISRGTNKRGTVGMGISDAVEESRTMPDLSIRAGEFLEDEEKLRQKIEAIRVYKLQQARELFAKHPELKDSEAAQNDLRLLEDEAFVSMVVDSFVYLSKLVKIVGEDHLDEVLARKGAVICEPSHGALHHPRQGFVPHITQIDPTSQDILETLGKHAHNKKVIRLGVSRCYLTRHGAGPLVSFSQEFTDQVQETHNAAGSEWLGQFRNGYYDVIMERYAMQISGGRESFNGLVISHLDVLNKFNQWPVVEAYIYEGEDNHDLDQYFETKDGKITGIKFHEDTGDESHLDHQRKLTKLLKDCKPVLTILKPGEGKTLEEVFLEYAEKKLGVPVVAVAHGPKAEDRKLRSGYENLF